MKLKTEEYKGKKLVFEKRGNRVFVKAPEISSRYLGSGSTKEQALNGAKDILDKIVGINKGLTCKYEDMEPARNDLHAEYRKPGHVLRIYPDMSSESPREWDNLGIMITSHRRYSLGDEQFDADRFDGWADVKKYLKEERGAIEILPLYLYDHGGGITIKTTPFGDRWDSGQVGFIYTTKEQLDMMGSPRSKAREILKSEVEVYDQYLSGEVFGYEHFICRDGEWVNEDSVWGFFGDDMKKNGIFDSVGEKGWKEV